VTPRIIGLVLGVVALLLDQISKTVALAAGSADPTWAVPVAPFFNLVLVRNDGVSFGLLGGHVPWWVLSLFALLVIAYLLWWLWRETSSVTSAGLGLIIGGAVGNVLDRYRHGAVTDFLDFHAFGWHWPAFNLADVAIFSGVACLLWGGFGSRPQERM
jgi:signal peptidase II